MNKVAMGILVLDRKLKDYYGLLFEFLKHFHVKESCDFRILKTIVQSVLKWLVLWISPDS